MALVSVEDLFLVRDDLILELADLLARRGQRIGLAIETFVTMTTHTAALCKQIATEIQRLRSLRDAIASVTLLATGLRVLFLKHGPQPETVTPVSFYIARGRAAVAPVTTRTTKLFRIVKSGEFLCSGD